MIDVPTAQEALRAEGLDGWLLYDFKGLNPIAGEAVAPRGKMLTRRFFCLIPREGPPRWLVHAIERAQFEGLAGEFAVYARREELAAGLCTLVSGAAPGRTPRLAMEYSPLSAIPTISRVDAGTVELVRASGAEVVSSGDLVQLLLARWPTGGRALHDRAARTLERAVARAFDSIGDWIRTRRAGLTEQAIQKMVIADLEADDLVFNGPPIVAVNAHAADPHYATESGPETPIRPGDVVMLDVWAKKRDDPAAIYADITWMGYVGEAIPERVETVFRAVVRARDRALEAAQAGFRAGTPVRGFEVDRAARRVVEEAGFGPFFTHRTGHSLGVEDHWIGANMDDFETHDERRLVPGTGFTIEPGIYLPGEFGVRSEIDVFVGTSGPEATTAVQRDLVRIRCR
jgi:Xaa-Pro dipeptidase